MSKEKQIEEITNSLYESDNKGNILICGIEELAEALYNAGCRKQSEGEWVSYISPVCLNGDLYYKCSICGESDPYQHTTRRAKFCSNCGAKMKEGKKK